MVALVCCALFSALFLVLVNRKGGRAGSGPVVVSALPPAAPAPQAPEEPVASAPARPLALPYGPALGPLSRFEQRVRFNPPILPIDTRSFEADGISVTIAGMEPPAFEQVCYDDKRALWACGRYARAALFNRIRSGVLICQPRSKTGTWACEHNGEDIALWMIRLGWARPASGSPLEYTSAMLEAQASNAGLWNGGWTYYAMSSAPPAAAPASPEGSGRGTGQRARPAPR